MLNVSQPVVPNAKGTPIVFQAANPAVLWATLPEKTDSDVIFRITVYSHHFKVVPLTDIARKICFSFVRRYIISSTTGPEPVHTAYASSNTAKTWFRFHINTLDDWKRFIYEKGYSKAAEYTEKEYFTPTKVALALKDGWKHKPEQEPVRDYLAAPVGVKDPQSGLYPEGTGAKARLVGISTGAGKTFCALAELARRGEVFVAIVLAQFVGKWVNDIANTLKVDKKEILKVQGSAELKALTEMAVTKGALEGFKAIVISNRTYENYLRAYERHENELQDLGYLCKPEELFEKLGAGTRLIDEVHMQFYAQYRLDLYTHVPQSISLSATLINKDPEIERIYKTAYPMPERYREGPVDKFTDAYAVRYSVNPRWRYKTSYKEPNYSQNAYEESILKNKEFAVSYCQMIKTFVQAGYVRNYEPGHKAIIFCGTVAMCGHLATYLQNAYPQYNVKRYVAEDPYEENYKQPDIRVTTIGSGGTGHDVPGMTDAHLTPGLESIQANIQAFGRLRKIPNKQTRFYFYTNTDIRKHLKYDRSKTQLMRERAKSLTPIAYGELY